VRIVAGVDLGGTAINYTLVNKDEQFLIEGLCEHPALTKQGPDVCLQQIEDGLAIAAKQAGVELEDIVTVGLDTPGPASSAGVLSARGSTNFMHEEWKGFDIRAGMAYKLGRPVTYLNDANAGALWGHFSIFGANSKATSISIVIGTGTGGGVILEGNVLKGRVGFGGELGHALVPYQTIARIEGIVPQCNCGRVGDLESLASLTAIERTLLPYFLKKYPGHKLGKESDLHHPDAFIVGGGVLEASAEFGKWFLDEIKKGMPTQREEQAGIPIYSMPNGDTAGARGAAIEALTMARQTGLI